MRLILTLTLTLSFGLLSHAGLISKSQAERALADARRDNNQAQIQHQEDVIKNCDKMINDGLIACATIIGAIVGAPMVTAGTEEDLQNLSEDLPLDCWKSVVDSGLLSEKEIEEYTKHGMPMAKVLQLAQMRLYGTNEEHPMRFVKNNEEYVPRISQSTDDGYILHMEPYQRKRQIKEN